MAGHRGAARSILAAVASLTVVAACGAGGDAAISTGVPQGGARPTIPTVTTAALQGPPAGPPPRPVCDLVAAAEVAKAVGNPVRAGTGDPAFCFWATSVDRGTSADVTVGVPSAGQAAQACAVQKLSLPKESSQEAVAGVATSAVWSYQQVALLLQGSLVACWADAVLRVSVTGEHDQASLRQSAVALAEAVHGRL